ncbi:transferase family [Fusarium agapanthi]|uniref:Transferase family n=1 Tax=Fusarium agapanthi TaxID=1803897 RepID=A0A9P5EB21_9HYPO|nr:transferase family [Fusarium agapanthi]
MDAARILPRFAGDDGARPWATLYEKGDRLYSHCVLLHGHGTFMNLFATFLFEQRAVNNEHWALHQGIFHTFPDMNEFNFKDLFIKHPKKPNLWLYMGRSNDIICLEDAQKLSPIETENMICAHPSVNGCVMTLQIGNGQKFACLMVELKQDVPRDLRTIEGLLECLGDIIDQADQNQLLRGYLRRDYIIIADPKQPLPRTEKGTISRRAALKLYEKEIDAFYRLKGEATVGVGQRTSERA